MYDDIHTAPALKSRERYRYLLMVQAQHLRAAAGRTCLRGDRAAMLGAALTLEALAQGVHEGLAVSIPAQ